VDLKRKRYSTEFVWENDDRLKVLLAEKKATVVHGENCTIVRCDRVEELLTEEQKIAYCIWKYKY
jgi:hypothetical protein